MAVLSCGVFAHLFCMIFHPSWLRDGQYFFIFPTALGIGYLMALFPIVAIYKLSKSVFSSLLIVFVYFAVLVGITMSVQLILGGTWPAIFAWIRRIPLGFAMGPSFVWLIVLGRKIPWEDLGVSMLTMVSLTGIVIALSRRKATKKMEPSNG
jgi:hypothetical protein